MTHEEVYQLDVYNSEVARGLVHHSEWHAKMAKLQRQFDAEQYGVVHINRISHPHSGPNCLLCQAEYGKELERR